MAIGNMQKNFCKDCVCGSGDILIDRQVDIHRYAHHSTYAPHTEAK